MKANRICETEIDVIVTLLRVHVLLTVFPYKVATVGTTSKLKTFLL